MLMTAVLEMSILISQEYYISNIDLVIRINNENRQIAIKTLNYCNGVKIDNTNVEKIKKYELSKIKRICDEHHGTYHETQQDNEIIVAASIYF